MKKSESGALVFLMVSLLTMAHGAETSPGRLQTLIDQAPERGEVVIPAGTWKESIVISKPIKLRGASSETSILDVTSDQPAIQVKSKEPVILESLTIRWQRATSERSSDAIAMVARDTPLTIRSVRFQAAGNNQRCPGAVFAAGFSDVKIEQCHFEGFDFPVQYGQGAQGSVVDSVVWKPGHAGITVGPDCTVEVVRCLVAGSAFHGIRCTGGKLIARDNLVIANKNRGFYLGNKSAAGSIRNNLIQDNTTGISGFGQSEVEVAHNVISKSEYAALDARDTCRLRVHDNIFLENTRGLVLFKDSGVNKNDVQTNLFWANKTNTENFVTQPQLLQENPQLKDPANGDFGASAPGLVQGHGLTDAAVMKSLWAKWTALSSSR